MLHALVRTCLALWVGLVSFQPVANAQAPAVNVEAPLNVEVALVKASRGTPGTDAALGPFQRDLAALPFTTFVRVDGKTWATRKGAAGEADLGDLHVSVAVTATSESEVTATITVTRGGKAVASTSFSRPWGRAHVVSVGNEGGVSLLVPVRIAR